MYEKYLDFHTDFKKRRLITKMRISSHRLEIELGRYQSKTAGKLRPEERICKLCNLGEVEDEKHALMNCPMYSVQRKNMLEELFEIFPALPALSVNEQFVFIMTCQDYEVFKPLCKMLEAITVLRGSL